MKHSTKNIFLDTNIIEGNNFFHGSHLQSLLNYSRQGVIKLYMTTISKMELIARMEKRLIETKDEHNKLIKSLNKHSQRILKNLRIYEEIDYSPLKIKDSLQELVNKLYTIIKTAEIQIIRSNNVNVEEVFDMYYKCLPPFSSNEKKRYEFPDAFILKTVENYCKLKKTKMIFLTNDNDFNNYKSKHLLFRNDIKTLLVDITNYFDSIQETQILPFIKEQFERNKYDLNQIINEEIKNLIVFDTDFEKATGLNYTGQITKYDTTSIRKDYAEISCIFNLKYEFSVFPTTFDVDRVLFEDNLRPKKIKNYIEIPCEIELNLKNENDIQVKRINSSQKIKIEYY